MPNTRVKDKFQVTIPASVRKNVGINVGDILEAVAQGNTIVLQLKTPIDKSKADAIEQLFAVLDEAGTLNQSVNDAEVMQDVLAAIQQVRRERHAARRP